MEGADPTIQHWWTKLHGLTDNTRALCEIKYLVLQGIFRLLLTGAQHNCADQVLKQHIAVLHNQYPIKKSLSSFDSHKYVLSRSLNIRFDQLSFEYMSAELLIIRQLSSQELRTGLSLLNAADDLAWIHPLCKLFTQLLISL